MIFQRPGDWDLFCELAWRSDDGTITVREKRELRDLLGQINPEMAWDLDWAGVMRLVHLTLGIYAIAHADEVPAHG
ncbi:MAG: hypothetical protein LC620_07525 [Halobacteriales archaeon]|nr:hypothetical protein [Halobacteriales archaeon]